GAPDVPLTTLGWDYLNGTQTAPSTGVSAATITMTAPSANGSYEARFYPNDLYTPDLARATTTHQPSAPPPSPSITVNGASNAVVTQGAWLAVAVANGPATPSPCTTLYRSGAPDVPLPTLGWDYLNGTQTAPSTGVSAATIMMTAPSTNGSYEARFYPN